MVRLKRIGAFLLVAAVAVTMLAGEADANKRRSRQGSRNNNAGVSNVTIDFTDNEPSLGLQALLEDPADYFSGTVSRVKKCNGKQQVEVFRAAGGTVGEAVVAANGDWTVEIEDPGDDTYYAKITGVKKRGGKRICARGTSALLEVDDDPGNVLGLP